MILHTLAPFILLIYCVTSASVGMAQSFEPTGEWVEPVTGMTFVYVKGGCYQMGCEDNGIFANNITPHRETTDYASIADIPIWQWPLAVAAAFLPVGCVYGRDHYDRTVCQSNEQPVHEVCVDSFWMSKYEVTQTEYKRIVRSYPRPSKKMARHPVVSISWGDIQTFLNKLEVRSRIKYKLPNEENWDYPAYRLPTEAEWEYAARSGGKMEKYAGGNSVDSIGWYYENSGHSTHKVGTKSPNGLGLYDMSGNVKELCSDWYDDAYYTLSPRTNPQGPSTGSFKAGNYSSRSTHSKTIVYNGSYHIYRGGSWADDSGYLTTVKREFEVRPEFIISNQLGFRPVFSEGHGDLRIWLSPMKP